MVKETPQKTSRFSKFLGKGGITASPTDGSHASPATRPAGRTMRNLAYAGIFSAFILSAPMSQDPARAQPLASSAQSGVEVAEEAKSRYQEHLERGIEMTWFRSGTRPMTTVLYFDRNRLSMGIERHGGIDRPAEVEGAPTFTQFMQVKQMQYQMGMHGALGFVNQTLDKVPGFKDAEPGDGSGLGDLKEQIQAITQPDPQKPMTVVQASQKAASLVTSTLALAEYHKIELPEKAAETQNGNVRGLMVNALIMNMAVNARAQTERGDAVQRQKFLEHMLTPPTPPQNGPRTYTASDDQSPRQERQAMTNRI